MELPLFKCYSCTHFFLELSESFYFSTSISFVSLGTTVSWAVWIERNSSNYFEKFGSLPWWKECACSALELPQAHLGYLRKIFSLLQRQSTQSVAALKGKEDLQLETNPNLSATSIQLMKETTEFLFMRWHPTGRTGSGGCWWKVCAVDFLEIILLVPKGTSGKTFSCDTNMKLPLYSRRKEYRIQPLLQYTFRAKLCSSATGFRSEVIGNTIFSMCFANRNLSFFPPVKLFSLNC